MELTPKRPRGRPTTLKPPKPPKGKPGPVSKGYLRINTWLSPETVARLDKLAAELGVERGAVASKILNEFKG